MSLINRMLRDLQQQKKTGDSTKPEPMRPKMIERIPYLPLPVVLGVSALVLLCLVWWLAGALSDMMFGFESPAKSTENQQVVANEDTPTASEAISFVTEQNQITTEEREVEPPVVTEQIVGKEPVSVTVQSVQATPAEKTLVVKQVVSKPATAVAKSSTPAVPSYKQASPSVSKPMPAKRRPMQAPVKVVAKASTRLHPDDLPGAIQSSSLTPVRTESIAIRPSKAQATTPYGLAEEAYLDGKWALAQERSALAVRSLQHALKLYQGHLPARELLVEILGKKGKTGEAMFLLAEGLEIAPDYLVFKKKYARLLVEQGDYDAATKVMLNGGLPTVEDDPEAHVVMASLYQQLGESFLAAQTYRNLLVAWPQTGAFWVGLGGVLEGQQLSEEAVVCYQRALKTKGLRQDLSLYAKKRLSLLN